MRKQTQESVLSFEKKIHEYEEGRSIVYVDESGGLHMICQEYMVIHLQEIGCYATQNWNAKGRQNVIAGLFADSLIGCGIVEDNVDTEIFNTWIKKILIPDLPENSVVAIDNAASHKNKKHSN